eukprot:763025-Hanusia_phi.AAC.6
MVGCQREPTEGWTEEGASELGKQWGDKVPPFHKILDMCLWVGVKNHEGSVLMSRGWGTENSERSPEFRGTTGGIQGWCHMNRGGGLSQCCQKHGLVHQAISVTVFIRSDPGPGPRRPGVALASDCDIYHESDGRSA